MKQTLLLVKVKILQVCVFIHRAFAERWKNHGNARALRWRSLTRLWSLSCRHAIQYTTAHTCQPSSFCSYPDIMHCEICTHISIVL